MSEYIPRLADYLGLEEVTVYRLLWTIIVLFMIFAIRWVILRVIGRRIDDVKQAYYAFRFINYFAGALIVVSLVAIWFQGFENWGTFLGLLSAGIAVALSDLLSNFAAWMFIMIRRPFGIGDRIEVDGVRGDVIDIRLFQTFMLECGGWVDADQSTGRIVMVPNNKLFSESTTSYTRGFEHIWDELAVLITFESDWERAKEIVSQIAKDKAESLSEGAQDQIRRAARKHMIFFHNLTPIVYTDVKDSGIQLSIRFLTRPRQRRSNKQRIWEAILHAFAREPRIDLAYPTVRYFAHQVEGKPKMQPEAMEYPEQEPSIPDAGPGSAM